MARVIDDDDKAMSVIRVYAHNYNGGDYADGALLERLRAKIPDWWDDIDPLDDTTWVDCRVWIEKTAKLTRVFISDFDEVFFHASDGKRYMKATPTHWPGPGGIVNE